MKRILVVIVIILLAVNGWFTFQNYRRTRVPGYFEYQLADSVDANYYDATLLGTYYSKAYEAGRLARELWHNYGVDIHFYSKEAGSHQAAFKHHQQLYTELKVIEAKFRRSLLLKQQGLTNAEIAQIDQQDIAQRMLPYYKSTFLLGSTEGDRSQGVYTLQGMLLQRGYEMPHDGVFGSETDAALRAFQTAEGLYASGQLDSLTLIKLLNL